ncbi:molybdenum ABC transporter ATP-binding protein [Alisedimentitalea sp. MJ-SS2]|uniref:molybdenum ABC transporter ATP-binding protein n=1 Tax=Aliisedimentitalea sp. MJ-SS2 TaxID=3049795 RepID=UPI00290F269A|nr:molybdenum ABC transporter ATP-binding protein [Alisedimentitalea sp. MJ-SS2]MDU8929228.1 molybdenum ABC transporter ATP-binding protein [Alisedimentitalea sp. MJ-SS2]
MTLSVSIAHSMENFTLNAGFTAPPGLTVLFGRSGSGKTTLINAVSGLLTPQSGRIAVGEHVLFDSSQGINLPPHRRRLGYIFQEGRLFPHLTVRQNLSYGRWFAPKSAPRESLDKVIEMLGVGSLLSRRPAQLSGGEKQRVAIGRALLAAPRMILADEPLAALDEPRKAEILPYFERLRDEVEIPILYVSHSATEVARLATTIVVLDDGHTTHQGSAAEVLGDPEISPAGVRSIGAFLTASVAVHHDDGLTELDAGGTPLFLPRIPQAPGDTVRIRIAAHDVILARRKPEGLSALNTLMGTINAVRPGSGPGAIVSLDTPAGRVLARITRRSAAALELAPGVPCYAVVKTVSIAPRNISGPAVSS